MLSADATAYLERRGVTDPRVWTAAGLRENGEHRIVFPWRDADGNDIYTTGRSLNGTTPKYKHAQGPKPPLYAATKRAWHDETVGLCEGQMDALVCVQAGLPTFATSGSSLPDEAIPILRQKRHVILIPDRDEAGARWREEAVTKLLDATLLSEVVVPDTHKDIAEVAERGTIPIVELLKQRRPIASWHEPAPSFIASASQIEISWLIEDLWTDQAVGFIGGEPKVGKSWIALEIALAVATGISALGRFKPHQEGNVLIVQEEAKRSDLSRRIQLLARGHHLAPDELGRLHVAAQPGVLLDDEEWQQKLTRAALLLEAPLVVLDPIVRMHSVNEDAAGEMRPIFRFLRRLQAEAGCAVMVIHHLGKKKENLKVRPGQRLRGSGDFHALLDSGLYLDKPPKGRIVSVTVEHREAEEPEPFMFELLHDPENQSTHLHYQAGELADIAILEAMPDVENQLRDHPEGLTKKELETAVPRRAKYVRQALERLIDAGRATDLSGKRADAAGRQRTVKLWIPRSTH